jgi:hypothetical protein
MDIYLLVYTLLAPLPVLVGMLRVYYTRILSQLCWSKCWFVQFYVGEKLNDDERRQNPEDTYSIFTQTVSITSGELCLQFQYRFSQF